MKSGKSETWTKIERGKNIGTRGVGGSATWGSSRLSWYSAGGLFAPLHVAFEKFGEVAPLHQGNELRQHLFGALLKAYSGLGHDGVSENGRCQTVEGVGHCATTDVPVLFADAHGRRQLEQEMEHSFLNNALGQWFAINLLQNLPCDKPLVFRLEVPAAGPSEVLYFPVLCHARRFSWKNSGRLFPGICKIRAVLAGLLPSIQRENSL